jgi:predicted TIM-barrel fold metal-dependent hydrolase
VLKLFSADDHIIEHANVWADRLPARYRDVGPHVVTENGEDRWAYEGQAGPSVNIFAAGPSLLTKSGPNESRLDNPTSYRELLAGCYDPYQRSLDFLNQGVVASVSFPSLPRFGGTLFLDFDDAVLADLCVEAYNDFILDEWCPGGVPGMFVPMTICQLWDPAAAAAEIRRCVERGARAISFPENVVSFGLPSFYTSHWDPVWRVCEESETVICMHLATSGGLEQYKTSPEVPLAAWSATAIGCMANAALMNLLFAPVCSRFPALKIVLSESGIGWLPSAIERADLAWERKRGVDDLLEERPSEIWRRNVFVCQVEEHLGLQFVDHIGAEKVLWELDYPHPDTVFPFAQQHASSTFADAGLTDEQISDIAHRNSERLFRWTPAEQPGGR